MVLLLQISDDDIAVAHTKNSILKPWLNLIRASFGETESKGGRKRGGLRFLLLWSAARKWDPRYNVKDRAQAGM